MRDRTEIYKDKDIEEPAKCQIEFAGSVIIKPCCECKSGTDNDIDHSHYSGLNEILFKRFKEIPCCTVFVVSYTLDHGVVSGCGSCTDGKDRKGADDPEDTDPNDIPELDKESVYFTVIIENIHKNRLK